MKKEVKSIIQRVKELKIHGASNIAKAALKAYILEPTPAVKKALINARPTEPLLVNVVNKLYKCMHTEKRQCVNVPSHFPQAREKINRLVFKLINNGDVIYTHCYSTNVIRALVYAKKHGKRFEVYNTETRPMFQGRETARELSSQGIRVTTFIDAAMAIALENKQGSKKVTKIFIGCDAILKNGIINKIGSGIIAELSHLNKIPLYVIADSWKFIPKNVKIEERDFHEVWTSAPRNIRIRNPSFEFVHEKYITKIVSELGTLDFRKFLQHASRLL
uniref:R15P Isomerase n=1 Tax=uncultured Nanobdellati archaeon TaxID=2219213 RepID=A0A447IU49_9ARCH|nr:R15P Isomerase [uncultured DPANN archaeon]